MRKLFKFLKPYWVYAVLSPLLMIGEVTADLCLPYLMIFAAGAVGVSKNR